MVKRYDIRYDAESRTVNPVRFPDGPYVEWPDYAALLEEQTKALDGTGHATLAEMRREFDAMRAESRAWKRRYRGAFLGNPGTVVHTTDVINAIRELDDAVAATDAARPKEPTKEKDNA